MPYHDTDRQRAAVKAASLRYRQRTAAAIAERARLRAALAEIAATTTDAEVERMARDALDAPADPV